MLSKKIGFYSKVRLVKMELTNNNNSYKVNKLKWYKNKNYSNFKMVKSI